jgi:hypothetical protein
MSTPRRPLGELPINIVRGKELTPNMRGGKVIRMHLAGHNVLFIIVRLKLSCYAIQYTIEQDKLRDKGYT